VNPIIPLQAATSNSSQQSCQPVKTPTQLPSQTTPQIPPVKSNPFYPEHEKANLQAISPTTLMTSDHFPPQSLECKDTEMRKASPVKSYVEHENLDLTKLPLLNPSPMKLPSHEQAPEPQKTGVIFIKTILPLQSCRNKA
jgi:hypothetical protein